jgi:uncharacterized protein YgbK (DUF1537 family)
MFVIGAAIGWFSLSYSDGKKVESQLLAEKIIQSIGFVDIETVNNNDELVYLGYDLLTRKFVGQSGTLESLYQNIFQKFPKYEVLYVRTDPNSDELIAIDKSLKPVDPI